MVDVVFRCDASIVIGTGHVMRCLVLADSLVRRGLTCAFICRAHQGHWEAQIRRKGYSVFMLPLKTAQEDQGVAYASCDRTHWLGVEVSEDADQIIEIINALNVRWVIDDHYGIDSEWENRVKSATGVKILAIDGQANRPHSCDQLLDPTFSARGEARWKGLVPAGCKVFSGLRYALLRPEFAEARKDLAATPRQPAAPRRLLIGFGGVDAVNATACAVEAVMALGRTDLRVDVVVGAQYPFCASLEALLDAQTGMVLHVAPPNMADLMVQADLAVCAGGTMLVELSTLAVPSFVYCVAENQKAMSRAMADQGMLLGLGNFDEQDRASMVVSLASHLQELLGHPERLEIVRRLLGHEISDDHNALRDLLDGS